MKKILAYSTAFVFIISTIIHDFIVGVLAMPIVFCTFMMVNKKDRKEFLNDIFDILNT